MNTNTANKIIGTLFLIIGIVCVGYPIMSSIGVELFVGAAFVCGAIFSLLKIPSTSGFWGEMFYLAVGVMYGIAGIGMMMFPVWGTMAVMLTLGAVFFAEGVMLLVYWSIGKSGGVMLFNGLITLALGVLVLSNITDGIWFLGVLAGIDFIFKGFSILAEKNA